MSTKASAQPHDPPCTWSTVDILSPPDTWPELTMKSWISLRATRIKRALMTATVVTRSLVRTSHGGFKGTGCGKGTRLRPIQRFCISEPDTDPDWLVLLVLTDKKIQYF